jgi:hypothetical protein
MGGKSKAGNIVELAKEIKFNNVLEVCSGEGSILYWLSKWNFSDNLYRADYKKERSHLYFLVPVSSTPWRCIPRICTRLRYIVLQLGIDALLLDLTRLFHQFFMMIS